MTPERWHRVRAVFDSAVEQPESQVEEFLREECAGDPQLYSEVRRMLDEHGRSGLLDHPPAAAAVGASSTPAQRTFETGSVISGRYRILRPLGRGGMGEVYEAEDTELKERVALKTLLPEIAADGRMIARFKQEIQLSRKIAHPNVCRVFDLARHPAEGSAADTVFFLTMEFLPGETLAARLRREGRMGAAEALPLLEQMAEALDAAHRAGVIHRDFKPSNVMLAHTAAGTRAVITDFGLARRATPSEESTATISGQLIGTVDYMAPELFTGSEASAASDIYALGLVAYKTITGELPFESAAPLAAVIRRAGQPAPSARARVSDLDPAWDRALSCALDPDPARRFASGREFIQALRGEADSVTVKLPMMTRRRTAFVVGAAAMLVAGAFGWRAWEHARRRPSAEAETFYQKGADDLHAGAYFAATKALEQAVRIAPAFSLAHARLAEAWVELELPEKAGQELLVARRQDLSALARLERLQFEAIDLTVTREFAGAVAKYEQLLPLVGAGAADASVDLGRAYEKAGKPDKAIESYCRAAEGTGQHPAAWLRLAVVYNRAGNTAKSDEAFRQAEQLYQLTSNLEGLTEVAFQRGVAATARGQFEAAAGYLGKALETARLAGNIQQEVRVKLQLGTNAYNSGDAGLAERYALEALDTARAVRVDTLAIRALVTLGQAATRKRDFTGAEARYQEALTLARGIGSERFAALSLISLAAVHDQAAKPELALREATEALGFYQANGFAKETFQCFTIQGRAYLRRGDPNTALDVFQRAQTFAEKAQDRGLADVAEESLGSVLSDLERYPEALQHYQTQLALSATVERRGYAGLNYGNTLWVLGRYPEAISVLEAVEKNAGNLLALRLSLRSGRANMALSQERFAEAAALVSQALAEDTGQNARTRSGLARTLGLALLRSRHAADGLLHCRESFDLAAKVDDPRGLLQARLALSEALLAAGDSSGALRVFHEAEPALARYPVSRWQALATIARADPQYNMTARDALGELRRAWGEAAFSQYLGRPDVSRLVRPLLQSLNATNK
jgi:tetratricopeptide (TPR) repeat protein